MSSQEEQESQIDESLYQHTNEQDSPLPLECDDVSDAQFEPRRYLHNNEPGSEDGVSDCNAPQISSPLSQNGDLRSQVEDTQFVPIEHDTQPSLNYDMSPTSRRVLENTESISAEALLPVTTMMLLERPDVPAVSGGPEFRFGKPPTQNNLKHTRPPPKPHRPCQPAVNNTENLMSSKAKLSTIEHGMVPPVTGTMTDLTMVHETSSAAIKNLPNHGRPPMGNLAEEKDADSALPHTGIDFVHSPDELSGQKAEVAIVSSPKPQFQTPTLSNSHHRTEHSLSRRQPFEEAEALTTTTMQAELLAIVNSQGIADDDLRSPNQPKRRAELRSPPFMEATLSNNMETKTAKHPNAPIISAAVVCPSHGSGATSNEEIHISKTQQLGSRSIAGSISIDGVQEGLIPIYCCNQQEDGVQTPSEVTVRKRPDHSGKLPAATLDKRFPETRNPLCDLPRNNRPRSRNKNPSGATSKQGTHRLPSEGSASRPLPDHQLQPQDLRYNQALHNTRDSGISKKIFSRPNSPHHMQPNYSIPIEGNDQVNVAGLLHMATVMLTVEKEHLNKVVAEAQLQGAQMVDLSEENTALHDRAERLSEENQKLLTKIAGFRKGYEQCKARMNDVMKIQKELRADAKSLDRRQFQVLKGASKEMDTKLSEAKSQAFKDSREILKEAHVELSRQNQKIDLLNRDINNQLLDLQRERGLRESLQKQLENKEKQQEELKVALFGQQQNTVAILSGHEHMLKKVLDAGAETALTLTECQALMKSLNGDEPKPIPELIKLNEVLVALSASVEKKFQKADDASVQVRDAGVEVLAELKHRLKSLNEDQAAQQQLNVIITGLRKENAKLEERIRNREVQSLGVGERLKEVQEELQQCREQLSAANDDLGKAIAASREDTLLRTQLQDLKTSYSIAKQEAESSAKEVERIRAALCDQKNSNILAQQENCRLKDKLQQIEAEVFSLNDQRKAYACQLKEESKIMRVKMEQDFRARLVEDEARYNGIISGLRRQITEADEKLTQTQQRLQDVEGVKLNREKEVHKLFKQLSAVATEIGSLQDQACSTGHTRDQVENELRISQDQLTQCLLESAGWSARADQNALEFAKHHKEIDSCLKRSEEASEAEANRLKALMSALQKKNEDSDLVVSKVARYLRSRGVLRPDLAFMDWAVGLPGEDSQQETNLNPPQLSVTEDFYNVSVLSQESYSDDSRNSVRVSTEPDSKKQSDSSTRCPGEYFSHAANPPHILFDEDPRTSIKETENLLPMSFSEPSCKRPGQEVHQNENDLKIESLEFASASSPFRHIPQSCSSTEAATHANLQASGDFSGTIQLEGTTGIVMSDPQNELAQKPLPAFVRPPRRIAERRQSLAESNRTVTRTKITGYSIKTSETHVGTPTSQESHTVHVPYGKHSNDLRLVDSDEESSGLSEPPENLDKFDFAEFMDSGDGGRCENAAALRHSDRMAYADNAVISSAVSPRPNSSRIRTGPKVPKEIKQPKSILKRTKSLVQMNDTTVSAESSGMTDGRSRFTDSVDIRKETTVKRLSKMTSGTNVRDTATHHSPYNRPVAGSKDLQRSSHLQAHNVPRKEQESSVADKPTMLSSPGMGQPQRNLKKRALSGISINDNNRPTKFSRPVQR